MSSVAATGSGRRERSTSARLSQSRAAIAALGGGGGGEFGQLGREEEQRGIAARQHDDELVDISVAPAEAGRQRQRHGPQPGVDRAEEAGGEFGAGLGDQREPVALGEAERHEAPGMGKRIVAQLGIGIGAHEAPARVVEIHARGGRWRHNRALRRAWRSRRCGAARCRASASCPSGVRLVSIVMLRSSTRDSLGRLFMVAGSYAPTGRADATS